MPVLLLYVLLISLLTCGAMTVFRDQYSYFILLFVYLVVLAGVRQCFNAFGACINE